MIQFNSRDKEIVQKIKEKILEVNPEAEIYLYGSRARGDVHKESDWDILILLNQEKASRADERPFKYNIYDIELNYSEIISVFALAKSDWNGKYSITPFYENVMQERIKI